MDDRVSRGAEGELVDAIFGAFRTRSQGGQELKRLSTVCLSHARKEIWAPRRVELGRTVGVLACLLSKLLVCTDSAVASY